MQLPQPKTVCYFLSHYISHQETGLRYRECLQRLGISLVEEPKEADLVIIHNEPWTLPGYYRMYPELRERRVVVYAVWETDRLPEHYRFVLSLADEIWTCSSYCRQVLTQTGRPVSIIPHVVKTPERNPAAENRLRERIGCREGEFLFYTIANVLNPRKGIEELVRAFAGLFPVEQARLIVKGNAPLPPELAATPGLVQITEKLDEDEIHALHRVGDCFVSAHRAEGWNLSISTAMACERIVVATAYSGNMDYMNSNNSLPVACTVESIRAADIKRQPDLLTEEMHWAYVDADDLRRQMRRAFSERESLQPLVQQARKDMERYGPEQITEILRLILAGEKKTGHCL